MSLKSPRFSRGIILKADDLASEGVEGALKVASTAKKFQIYLDAALRNVVTEDQTQTLSNKTIVAANNTITTAASGNLAATELNAALAELQSDIDTRATQTAFNDHISDAVDAHDASAISNVPSGNLAATDLQGAVNELQSDIDTRALNSDLTTHTGATAAHGTTGAVVGTTDTQTLTNKTIAAASNTITTAASGNLAATELNAALAELQTDIDTRATSANLTSHTGATSAHGVTGSLVGTTDAQVLTNKDIDGGTASNTNRITLPKSTKTTLDGLTRKEGTLVYSTDLAKAFVDNGTELVEVGSGGAGGINYIDNSDAETDAAGYATYADAASASPADGTGGVVDAGFTFTRSTTSPLRDTASFLITKPALNVQGHGVSYDFNIDSADQAQILRVSFDYSTSSNYSDGDLRCYIYDRTNAQLIEVVDRDISAKSQGKYVGSFQSPSNSTALRLIFHVAGTGATSWECKLDSITCGPQVLVKGPVTTDWQSYTPSWTGASTNPSIGNGTLTGKYRRVGDSVEIQVDLVMGSTTTYGSSNFRFSLPSGLAMDEAKIDGSGLANAMGVATMYDDSTGSVLSGVATKSSNELIEVRPINSTTHHATATSTSPWTWATNDRIHLNAKVPVVGWSSNVVLSEDTANRQVEAWLQASGSQILSTGVETKMILNTAVHDTTSSGDLVNYRYVFPESGYYKASGRINFNGNATGNRTVAIYSSKTAQNITLTRSPAAGSQDSMVSCSIDSFYVNKGDYIELRGTQNSGGDLSTAGAELQVSKNASPQTLAGSETVVARYSTNAGQAVVSGNIIIFEDKAFDSHNAYGADGRYSVPVSGKYQIFTQTLTASVSAAIGNVYITEILVNGVRAVLGGYDYCENTTSRSYQSQTTALVDLKKGDLVDVRWNEDLPAVNLAADGSYNQLQIIRVGN